MLPKQIAEYEALRAEYDLTSEASDAVFGIEAALKKYQLKGFGLEGLKDGIAARAIEFLQSLNKRIKDLEKELEQSAVFFLRKQHGILVGEKIPYSHPGVNDSGYLRVERVDIFLKGEFRPQSEDWFLIHGVRFKSDGKLGRREMQTALSLDRAKCDA